MQQTFSPTIESCYQTNMDSQFLTYSALDSACTLECRNGFWDDVANGFLPAYSMTVDLFPVLMFMQTRGIRVDLQAMNIVKVEILKTASQKQEELNELCGRELNVNSSKDCQRYFYGELGIPPYFNEGAITTDDTALQRLARGTAKRPGLRQAKLVQDIRGLQKLHSTYLDIEFDSDERMRCAYNPRGTKFGRLSSSATIMGTGCVPGDAEILTSDGWITISAWNPQSEQIAQFNPITNQITFVEGQLHSEQSPGCMITCVGEQIHQSLTPDHRVLYRPKLTGAYREGKAFDLLSRNMTVLPLAGQLVNDGVSITAPELLVAALADGSYEWNRVRIAFKKERKIKRFLELCAKYNIPVDEQAAREGYRRFAFNRPADWPTEKRWDSWLLKLNSTDAELILNELGFWDGIVRNNSHVFCTADEAQAYWVATLAHMNNKSATVTSHEQSEGSWSDTLMWYTNIKPRNYAYTEGKHWSIEAHAGKVYCPIVPSTYWVMRYKGKIAITGNTNMQNLPQEFKKFLLADEGYLLWEIDKRQAEWIVMAYLSNDANMIQTVEEGSDTHVHTAHLMYGTEKELIEYEHKLVGNSSDTDYISRVRSEDQILAQYTRNFPRNMSARQCGKKSNHGLNYDEGPNRFALLNEIEIAEAKRIVALYHEIYPGIRGHYYQSVQRQLQKDRSLTNCFGRKVRFMDAWGHDLWKAAYSMLPQSTVVDSLNKGMISIYHDEWITRTLNVDVLAQVHDSVLMQVPVNVLASPEFAKLRDLAYNYVSPGITYNSKTFKIATDMKLGLNWGSFHRESNPCGMRDVKDLNELPKLLESLGVQRTE